MLLAGYAGLLVSLNSAVAGGSDSSGYLNAAKLFSQGRAHERIEPPGKGAPAGSEPETFIPIGYRVGPRPGTMAARYPPGLPLHMALLAAIGGWSVAPFLAAPLAAIGALALFYRVARELGLSRGLASGGVLVLASCPIFLGMAIQPMSDVPATTWVLAAVLFALSARRRPGLAIGAGAAFGVAVWVRPTDALAVFALGFALPPTKRAIGGFVAAAAPFAVALAVYDLAAFGRAADTGYGAILSWTMALPHVAPNLRHYGLWVSILLTPLFPLAWLLLPIDRRVPIRDRVLLILWFGAFLAFHLFYEPFDDWWAARLLLPGIPALILSGLLLARDAAHAGGERGFSPGAFRLAGLAVLAIAVFSTAWQIRRFDLARMWRGELIYRDASLFADTTLPPRSLVVSMQMSGALKYYTRRPIARWDAIHAGNFPALRRAVEERGYRWYALLWPFEEPDFGRNLPGRWIRIGLVRDIGLWRLD